MNVVEFPQEPANDIVRMLREMADRVEQGDYGIVTGSVFILTNEYGERYTFGWGKEVKKAADVYYILNQAATDMI